MRKAGILWVCGDVRQVPLIIALGADPDRSVLGRAPTSSVIIIRTVHHEVTYGLLDTGYGVLDRYFPPMAHKEPWRWRSCGGWQTRDEGLFSFHGEGPNNIFVGVI